MRRASLATGTQLVSMHPPEGMTARRWIGEQRQKKRKVEAGKRGN
jgi:hypothetical protein